MPLKNYPFFNLEFYNKPTTYFNNVEHTCVPHNYPTQKLLVVTKCCGKCIANVRL